MEEEILREAPKWIREIDSRLGNDPEPVVDEVSKPRLQRVPAYVGARVELKEFYVPKLISFGPIHMLKPYVQQGRLYKLRWTEMYLQQTNQTFDNLIHRLSENYQDIKKFTGEHWNSLYRNAWGREFAFEKALVVDGCSVLQLLDKSAGSRHPEEQLMLNSNQLVRVHQDMLLLENQIPYAVLKLICGDDQDRLKRCMRNFLLIHGINVDVIRRNTTSMDVVGGKSREHSTVIVEEEEEEDPIHLLDYLRRALLARDRHHIPTKTILIRRRPLHLRKYRIGTIRELKAAGIRIRKRKDTSFYPIFMNGRLELPEFTVDGSTALIFYNLIAYEMCPDFRNNYEISSHLVFLGSLVDHPEDVKELRHAGILRNDLASDKEVADLFNQMDFLLVPGTPKFAHIRDQIEAHFESRRGRIRVLRWIEEAYKNYLRSPWTVIALLAATLALVLTFIQTWYTMHPP
ncbi:uncharacterized protein LOC133284086 [Gastrolobium bilobum]|uniref:uncharacterized protein LOC133284086 n=1 Tax=Gastrolobium bilobum TaxID=150636 RepID=UPI002AB10FCB|nr:uncharacterized protein LOC133284086 [Gastrolobium bilobum]